jgi:hypothetical protein
LRGDCIVKMASMFDVRKFETTYYHRFQFNSKDTYLVFQWKLETYFFSPSSCPWNRLNMIGSYYLAMEYLLKLRRDMVG